MTKNKLILILILLLAAGLRLWRLTDYPAGFNADEAALGYNAYSLLLTGRDEHGHPLPVNLESFGDFKPALYAYLLVPVIKLLGLTEFAVRLPSALFGILAVLFIYVLTHEIFSHRRPAAVAALVLAVSPWHLHFSRGAWEVNLATTFLLVGLFFFIRWTKNKKFIDLTLSAIPFTLSLYTYQSARIIIPLLGLGLAVLFRRRLAQSPRQLLSVSLLTIILLIPLILSLISSDAASRLAGVGLLADEGPLRRVEQLRGQHRVWDSPLSRLLHNRPVIYAVQFISNYTDHFLGDFLFINGDEIARNRIPETGLLYLTDFVFLALGAALLMRQSSPHSRIIWLWLVVAPVASALTFQTPHALRAHSLVVPLTILVALGLSRLPRAILPLVLVLYSWQFARYLHQYYVHYPRALPAAWEYGFKDLVSYTESIKDKYDKILVTDIYDQPYILFLFYSRYPPDEFQGRHQLTFRDRFNFSTVRDYDQYHFESTPWDKVRDTHSALIVAAPEDIPGVGVNIVKTINFPNGLPAFKIVSN